MSLEEMIEKAINYHQVDRLDKAVELYKSILQKVPNHQLVLHLLTNIAQGHYQLAQALMQMGRIKKAIKSLKHVNSIKTDIPDVHLMLGQLLIKSGENKQAAEQLRHYIRLVPDDKAGAIMLLAHIGEEKIPDKPSENYIQNFYGNYANNYDDHLVNRLNYKCPQIIFDSLKKNKVEGNDILDLGCGTGLCGVAIKSLAKRLDGVDLSKPMLEVANKRNIYDSLVAADIYEFLSKKHNEYDVVVAAGLFEHIGEPEQVFSSTFKVLRENGYFVFTTDENKSDDIGVNAAGFYMHGKSYLEEQAKKCGFEVISIESVSMWIENKKPVSGLIIILKKM